MQFFHDINYNIVKENDFVFHPGWNKNFRVVKITGNYIRCETNNGDTGFGYNQFLFWEEKVLKINYCGFCGTKLGSVHHGIAVDKTDSNPLGLLWCPDDPNRPKTK